MTTSMDISGRFWNLPRKGDEEAARENTFIDDIIQKAHIERKILSHLDGVETVFDAGAGSGRFSIMLARRGLKVWHFDISGVMIQKAKELAAGAGAIKNMTFIQGALEDLGQFHDQRFDLALCIDAPISYTYPRQDEVIGHLVRLASKRLMISVYSRIGWMPYQFNPAQKVQYILDPKTKDSLARWSLDHAAKELPRFVPDMERVRAAYASGLMEDPKDTAAAYDCGGAPWPVSYGFMPDELIAILEKYGAKNIRLSGPGALSRSIPNEVLVNIMKDEKLKKEFLDFSYLFDGNPWCAGLGKDNLMAVAEI